MLTSCLNLMLVSIEFLLFCGQTSELIEGEENESLLVFRFSVKLTELFWLDAGEIMELFNGLREA